MRRYGFHGLSYEYIAQRAAAARRARRAPAGRVVLHLGNGASMCAMRAGRSVASTMGFTAVDGLPMGTRCGNLDPGVMLYLMDELKMDARAIEKLIYQQSGLLGVSGISSDMRTLQASAEPARRLRSTSSSTASGASWARSRRRSAASTRSCSPPASARTAARCASASAATRRGSAWISIAAANERSGPRISTAGSRVAAWVIPTNEELMIARHTRRVLDRPLKEHRDMTLEIPRPVLNGRKALVVGVANEHSIA